MAEVSASQADRLNQTQVDSAVLQRFLVSERGTRVTPFAAVCAMLRASRLRLNLSIRTAVDR